jgi:glycosyltransferase involved in cell wall biosynthesis
MNAILIRSNPIRPYPRLEKMARCLLKCGYGVTVLAWDRDEEYDPSEEVLDLGEVQCPIIRIGLKGQFTGGIKKNLKSLLKFQIFIYRWLKEHRNEYDVIHAYDLDTGYIAQKASVLFNKVFVYDIPDYYADSHGFTGITRKIISNTENRVINHSFATIICSEERKEQIRQAHPNRLYIIHNTPYIKKIEKIEDAHERLRIGYVGIFGPTRFLKEITEYVAARSDCELHLGGYGGAGMSSYFEAMAEQYSNIYFYGRVPYDETLRIESSCDILPIIYDPGIPNHKYAAPNKFYEALALGKPMIMAKGTGMSSIVDEFRIGETMEYSVEGLEKAICRLVSRKNEWLLIGRKEQELYKTTYSWDEMERRIQNLYSEIEKGAIQCRQQ